MVISYWVRFQFENLNVRILFVDSERIWCGFVTYLVRYFELAGVTLNRIEKDQDRRTTWLHSRAMPTYLVALESFTSKFKTFFISYQLSSDLQDDEIYSSLFWQILKKSEPPGGYSCGNWIFWRFFIVPFYLEEIACKFDVQCVLKRCYSTKWGTNTLLNNKTIFSVLNDSSYRS